MKEVAGMATAECYNMS